MHVMFLFPGPVQRLRAHGCCNLEVKVKSRRVMSQRNLYGGSGCCTARFSVRLWIGVKWARSKDVMPQQGRTAEMLLSSISCCSDWRSSWPLTKKSKGRGGSAHGAARVVIQA